MEKLMDELREKIIETLNLEDIRPEDIGEKDRLVGGDLGLDSIDVLELAMMIERDYGIRIDNKELGAKVFASLGALAEYVSENSVGGYG
ncbi:MAG: acyl carrier protein [Deltaproteobacteria bacterium]|nr:acyl carrier protein [Deltaproteobacteria bacterium]MCF8119799.1 acyl carrier protein [Deltaproteobacteria bacterium]